MSHGHNDFDFEPIRGLPARLPKGERILWQGEPQWKTVAFQVFHVRLVAIYFAVLYGWGVMTALADGAPVGQAVTQGAVLAPLAALAIGVLCVLAWLVGRTTVYTVTNRRIVMRYGMALPVTVNLPFAQIASAALRPYPSGTGDIPLSLSGRSRLAYLHLWPHARPWRVRRSEPMLRAVPNAEKVAQILSRALVAHHGSGITAADATEERAHPGGAVATAAE
jgi:hypothetical protein